MGVGHRIRLVRKMVGSLLKLKKMHDAAKRMQIKENPTQEEEAQQRQAMESVLDEALPTFLQTAWAAVVTDIDGTTKEVGRNLMKDKSVPWQIRIRRAQALKNLGQIFFEEGSKAEAAQGGAASRVLTSE